jgi:hypothetical protein
MQAPDLSPTGQFKIRADFRPTIDTARQCQVVLDQIVSRPDSRPDSDVLPASPLCTALISVRVNGALSQLSVGS